MLEVKNPRLKKFSMDLETEIQSLKEQLSRKDEEIERLAKWKREHTTSCTYMTCYDSDEFGHYQFMKTSCYGEIGDDDWNTDWTYCPYCGGKIIWEDQYEQDRIAYEMHVDAEIDYRLGK